MVERRFSEDEPVMVSIRCITYNHAPYIRQCLEGFVMQKTNFRFQAVVHDDASTDGTTDIVKEYAEKFPDIIVPMYEEENRWSKHDGSLLTIMLPYMYKAKYWAECEGDDYWIDPFKLQKQVDYMESHPECSYCGTNGIVVWEGGQKRPEFFNSTIESHVVLPNEVIGKWLFPTASSIFRMDVMEKKIESGINTYGSDQTIILIALFLGEIYAMSDLTCVYRRDMKSLVSSTNKARSKGREYITEQQIKQYSQYNEYTKGKYANYVLPLISRLKKKSEVYKVMNYSYILACFRNPIVFITLAINKIKKRINV